jgi:hypothetical protein
MRPTAEAMGEARQRYEDAAAILRAQQRPRELATALARLGYLLLLLGDPLAADEALAIRRARGCVEGRRGSSTR